MWKKVVERESAKSSFTKGEAKRYCMGEHLTVEKRGERECAFENGKKEETKETRSRARRLSRTARTVS